MPRPRAAMRQIREVLRLSLAEGLSPRQIRSATGLGRTTVQRYLSRASALGLDWPLPDEVDDRRLEEVLFPRAVAPLPDPTRPEPDWVTVHRELRRKGVTLALLWMEYKQRYPDGFQYTWFTTRYREWRRHLDAVMRQEHRAGEKLFVDFAGQTVPIVNRETGVITPAELFVAVLGASNYTYAEVVPSQDVTHWVGAHVNCFEYLGGTTELLVPDNLKSGVIKPHLYEPGLNRTYGDLAAHYGCAIVPARVGHPRDKAKVEVGVQIVERWILASLRDETFYSVAEANAAVRRRLEWLNERPFKKLPGCRRSLFEEVDRPLLRLLPLQRYQFGLWKEVRVNIDYHVEVDWHYYSVPFQLVGQLCWAHYTSSTVEIFHRGRRVASHVRSYRRHRHTTDSTHMPEAHRRHQEWTPGRLIRWAEKTGPATAGLVRGILTTRPHPEQGFRSCLGIFRLGRAYGPERLEAACRRALAMQALSQRSVHSILRTGLDREPLPGQQPEPPRRQHDNLRGPSYYK